MNINLIILILTVVYLIFSLFILKKLKLNTKSICAIGIFTAMALVLRSIRVPLPTGSSIALLSVLPTMLLGVLYGAPVGMFSGILTGIMAMFIVPGYAPVHPLQIFVEHISAIMALGFAGMLGSSDKRKILLSCSIAITLNVLFHTFSGILFFSQYAPPGQGPVAYSVIYNLSSHGVEGLISILFISTMPIRSIKKALGGI